MEYTRREFGKVALATLPGVALLDGSLAGSALLQAKPNSKFNGVQIGTITYSFRSMPDQSAEATLKYCLESGISAIELMGGPAETFAGIPQNPAAAARGGGGGARAAAPGGGAPALRGGGAAGPPPCVPGQGPAQATQGGGGGGGGRGRGQQPAAPPTPEQQAAAAAAAEYTAAVKKWRTSVSMDRFKALRKMYNDAGVKIYAWKQLNQNMSDEEMEYIFNVAEALGCDHTTLELPTDDAALKRIGDFAMRKKIYAAYHTHQQGTMTAFDRAFEISKGNMANVDLGHYVAAGNVGGTPMQFLEKHHARISSFHIKDRTLPVNCSQNLAWGTGDTPIKEILQTVRRNKWTFPASIELEYAVPAGSDAVKETKKCVEFCRVALA